MPLLFDFIKRQFLSFPPAQTTSFANRTIIVTGASSGLGLEATRLLASLSATRIILACRSPTKGDAAIAAIRQSHPDSTTTLEVWPLDLLSYASILAFAARATADLPRVDGVILNAGIRTAHYSASPEGHEVSVQTNVISTALLACLLHPKLAATAHAHQNLTTHLSFVGSELYEYAAFKERHVSVAAAGRSAKANERPLFAALDDEATFKKNVADRYPVTKLLIAIFMRQLAELAPVAKTGVVVNVIAPGYVLPLSHHLFPIPLLHYPPIPLHARPHLLYAAHLAVLPYSAHRQCYPMTFHTRHSTKPPKQVLQLTTQPPDSAKPVSADKTST